MLLGLLACEARKAAAPVAEGDSGGATAGWEAPTFACTLSRPLDVRVLPALDALYGPGALDVATLFFDAKSYAGSEGCPEERIEGETTTLTGDCTGEWNTWSGTWVELDAAEDWTNTMAVQVVDDGNGDAYALSGSMDAWEAAGEFRLDRRFSWSMGGFGRGLDGDWRVDVHEEQDADGWRLSGLYDVEGEEVSGDYCLVVEETVSDCELEPAGGWVVQGAERLVVTFDPDAACDGCGVATVDGAPVGQVCTDG